MLVSVSPAVPPKGEGAQSVPAGITQTGRLINDYRLQNARFLFSKSAPPEAS